MDERRAPLSCSTPSADSADRNAGPNPRAAGRRPGVEHLPPASPKLGGDEFDQAANRCKGRSIDFVVFDVQAETLFQHVDDADNGHGVKLGDSAQQWCVGSEILCSAIQAENVIENGENFVLDVQRLLPKRTDEGEMFENSRLTTAGRAQRVCIINARRRHIRDIRRCGRAYESWQTPADHQGKRLNVFHRLTVSFRQLGWVEGAFYLLGQSMARLSGQRIRLIRYHLVAQPVPATAAPQRTGRTSIVFVRADDPIVTQFPRGPAVNARRFANGHACLVARTDERFTGHIWLARGTYDEDTVRCLYAPAHPQESVWDYDVYVEPEFRMGRTFSRLWTTANSHLHAEGVRWSYSRIAATNPQSLDSHSRLGIRRLYSATFVRLGKAQLMLAGAWPFVHLSLSSGSKPVLKLKPPVS